jgi:hypothetical protein
MFDRENAVGLLLLAVCAVVGGVMVFAIATDTELRYTGPAWLVWVLLALFLGGSLYGLFAGGRLGGGRRWPHPTSGRRPWWQFWRRDDDARS